MIIGYKGKQKNTKIAIQDLKDSNLVIFCAPDGKLDLSYFDDFLVLFLSNLESDIRPAFKALIRYAKEGNYDLFIQNCNTSQLNKLMIDTAFDNKYDFLENTLDFYKCMTKCNLQQLNCILDDQLMEFFYSIYREPPNLICKSYVFKIFSNILQKSQSHFYSFINEGYHLNLIDIFWKHFEFIEENDDDSRVVASILKLLPVFYLNNDVILVRKPDFFHDWSIAFSECFKIDNWIITPALVKSLQRCSNIRNIQILYQSFFVERYFLVYFNYCLNSDQKIRKNMISTFLNFTQLESDDIERIVNAGLFNIQLRYDEIDADEIIQILNVMYNYLLKSKEISLPISYSRILFDINNGGVFLTYQIKEWFFIVLSQLIHSCQKPVLFQVFTLCPLYIEYSCELLDTISDKHKIIILRSYLDLTLYLQIDNETELSMTIKNKLFSSEMFESLNSLLNNHENMSDDVSVLITSLKSAFPSEQNCCE